MLVTDDAVSAFASLSGDVNPLHLDSGYARKQGFPRRVAHGCLTLSYVSRLIGTQLPGDGALWRSLEVEWLKPVFPGDRVTITGTVLQQSISADSIVLEIEAVTETGSRVLRARATVGMTAVIGGTAVAARPTASAAAAAPPSAAAAGRAGRPVLVTGGSRGIGRAIALELARHGHPVAVGYHASPDAAATAVAVIHTAGGRALGVHLDAASPDSVAGAVAATRDAFGPALAVVHAATPPLDGTPVTELDAGALEPFWRIYVVGGVSLVHVVLPAMKQASWGRLVFLGTSALFGAPPPKMAAYVAAKSALVGLARSLAVELGPFGITTNVVSPGLTLTDLTRDTSPRAQLAEAQKNPMRRLAQPEDTAAVVAFLLGDEAAFINGVHLPVTGGAAIA